MHLTCRLARPKLGESASRCYFESLLEARKASRINTPVYTLSSANTKATRKMRKLKCTGSAVSTAVSWAIAATMGRPATESRAHRHAPTG